MPPKSSLTWLSPLLLGSNPRWGHLGARHLYLLTYESGGELMHRYAREWVHFDATTCSPQWPLCPHLPPHSVRACESRLER